MGIANNEQGITKAEVKVLNFFCHGRIASARDKRNPLVTGRLQDARDEGIPLGFHLGTMIGISLVGGENAIQRHSYENKIMKI
jgi:hypothetical protein